MRQWGKWLIYTILVVVVLTAATLFFLPSILGINLAIVYSGSMEPVMPVGALAVMEPVDPSEIKVGDIIAFNPVHDPDTIVSHRVIEVLDDGPSLEFHTKGDANEEPDLFGVPAANVLARVNFNISYVGNAFTHMGQYTRSRLGFVLLICLPTLVLIGTAATDMNFMFSPGKRRQRKLKQRRDRRNKRKSHW